MSSKKWLVLFCATVLFLGAAVLGFNWLVDPYGVFSHKTLEWASYEMTLNPRTAKMTYLEEHHQEYDSYLLGCSSTSSFPVESLNEYLDASFYNMIMYGADMLDVEEQAVYLLEHYEVKNLVVNVYLDNAKDYNTLPDPLRSYTMPAQTTGESSAAFLAKYLFMDPRHSLDKLTAWYEDTYLPQSFDVFDAETGAYDKSARDAEAIGDMDAYLESYPVFANYPEATNSTNEEAISGTLDALAHIRDLCEEKGVNFLVLCAPVYADYLDYYDWDQVADFYTRLAEVTPYWDFSYSSVSFEPRYFYDETHFRNCVGEMALARVFGDDSIYIPEDFGVYVTQDNVQAHLEDMAQAAPLAEESYTANVPVLMYHHIDEEGNDDVNISSELFEAQMAALAEEGYTAVFPDDLAAYVYEGKALPDKPVVITFDDGYLSNYEYAWPILEKYGMKATIFVIGSTIGNTEHYKDTDYPITPHFSYEQGAEMVASGVISIQSHTYDMHQWAPYEDSDQPRENILALEGESEEDYRSLLSADCQKIRQVIQEGMGEASVHVMAYPSGQFDTLSQVTLLENGFDITFTTQVGSNTLIKGQPQSLLGLHRYNMNESVSVEQMLEWVSPARG
ncbi:MAG: polysaccharide deacetylase family protein [Clostridiales bacterium]|nr:polysaccharide deacetylase family protein [Clostridiales bacterium]